MVAVTNYHKLGGLKIFLTVLGAINLNYGVGSLGSVWRLRENHSGASLLAYGGSLQSLLSSDIDASLQSLCPCLDTAFPTVFSSLSYRDNADGLMMTVLIQLYHWRPFFQIRSCLQVPSRHVFLWGTSTH